MATYFVASGGSNTSPYDTWAKAATSLQTALTAATGTGDIVVLQKDAVPSGDAEVSATTTWTFAGHAMLISATNDGGSSWTPSAMGTTYWIGNSTASYAVTLGGAFNCYVYGITMRTAGAGSVNVSVIGNSYTKAHQTLESCYFWSGTSASGARIAIGSNNATNTSVRLIDCTFRLGSTSQGLLFGAAALEVIGGSVSSAGSNPTTLFLASQGTSTYYLNGVDLSYITGTLVGDLNGDHGSFVFTNCKLGSSFTVLATQTAPNPGGGVARIFNSSGGDTHYNFGYYDALGQVTAETNITYTDAAANNKYDGTNRCIWKIVTTANATYHTPFVTPWFETYHSGTSAITPSIEVLTDGSSTALKDDEIWGEWSYQGTSGYPLASFVNDRRALAATAANQASSALGASDVSGEGGTNWYGKLAPGSTITPAEIGMLRARVCVGKASTTVYVDPTVRAA